MIPKCWGGLQLPVHGADHSQISSARLSALHNLLRGISLAMDNNDPVTARIMLTNAEHVVLAMMEQGT